MEIIFWRFFSHILASFFLLWLFVRLLFGICENWYRKLSLASSTKPRLAISMNEANALKMFVSENDEVTQTIYHSEHVLKVSWNVTSNRRILFSVNFFSYFWISKILLIIQMKISLFEVVMGLGQKFLIWVGSGQPFFCIGLENFP